MLQEELLWPRSTSSWTGIDAYGWMALMVVVSNRPVSHDAQCTYFSDPALGLLVNTRQQS